MTTAELARALKALSHPNRLELFFEIAKKHETSFEDCACLVSDIMGSLNIGAPTVSHHLKELANANLIMTERRGKNVVASINTEMVNDIVEALSLDCCAR